MPRSRKPKPTPANEPVSVQVDAAYNNETHAPLVILRNGDVSAWHFDPASARGLARMILDRAAEAEAIYLQKQTLAHVEASINQTIARLLNPRQTALPTMDLDQPDPAPQQEAS